MGSASMVASGKVNVEKQMTKQISAQLHRAVTNSNNIKKTMAPYGAIQYILKSFKSAELKISSIDLLQTWCGHIRLFSTETSWNE